MANSGATLPASEVSPKGPRIQTTKAYAAQGPTSGMAPITIPRRDVQPQDVQIEISFCGICHTDLHWVRNEWPDTFPTAYPCVPGHEIVGRVSKVGNAVKKFKDGDIAAVGCMVDSCRTCESCRAGEEQYCASIPVLTYNAPDKYLGGMTYGGYSKSIVVDENYVIRVPEKMNRAETAPLLCAGITTFAPLQRSKLGQGQKVGIIGLGGLGHMGVKFAAALGTHVVLFTTSSSKAADASRLGAHEVVLSNNDAEMQRHVSTFDLILDTVPAQHAIDPYINLLKRDGTLAVVGAPAAPLSFGVMGLLFHRRQIAGSIIGGIRETQEMLDFCADHNISADVETIRAQQIDSAFERLSRSDVKYRFVIDMASL